MIFGDERSTKEQVSCFTPYNFFDSTVIIKEGVEQNYNDTVSGFINLDDKDFYSDITNFKIQSIIQLKTFFNNKEGTIPKESKLNEYLYKLAFFINKIGRRLNLSYPHSIVSEADFAILKFNEV